jgi:hypothetical protein
VDEDGIECIGFSGELEHSKEADVRNGCHGPSEKEIEGNDEQQSTAASFRELAHSNRNALAYSKFGNNTVGRQINVIVYIAGLLESMF